MKNMLNAMIVLAATKFDGKFDKGGKPYILHCLAVMHKLRTEDEELQCMAVGHDLLEDTDVSVVDLRELGMTDRIIAGILAGTKMPGQSYEEYKAKVKSNPDTVKWKRCDLAHNSDLRRLKGVTAKDLARLQRYAEFYQELKDL